MSNAKALRDVEGGSVGLAEVTANVNGSASADPLKYDFTINGKAVRLKRNVPVEDGHALIVLLQACASNDLYDQVAICCVMVESWDFPGDPSDPAAYGKLETFDEFLPLSSAVMTHVQQRTARVSTKN